MNTRLEQVMVKAFAKVVARTKTSGVNMRTAAYMEGINRVAYFTQDARAIPVTP